MDLDYVYGMGGVRPASCRKQTHGKHVLILVYIDVYM